MKQIKCIIKGKTSGLTNGKIYNILKETEVYYFIINDRKIYQNYKKNRLLLIA